MNNTVKALLAAAALSMGSAQAHHDWTFHLTEDLWELTQEPSKDYGPSWNERVDDYDRARRGPEPKDNPISRSVPGMTIQK